MPTTRGNFFFITSNQNGHLHPRSTGACSGSPDKTIVDLPYFPITVPMFGFIALFFDWHSITGTVDECLQCTVSYTQSYRIPLILPNAVIPDEDLEEQHQEQTNKMKPTLARPPDPDASV